MVDYPTTATINASEGISGFLHFLNDGTGGWITNFLMIGLWLIVLIISYKRNDDLSEALAITGFSTFAIGLFFWLSDFLYDIPMGFVTGALIIGVLVLLTNRN
jgi:hypothetical protein